MEYENYLSDKSIKEKWNRLYQRDIINYREKLEEERQNRIKEEQEQIQKLRKEIEEDRKKRHMRKQQLINTEQKDLQSYFLRKRLLEERIEQDKREEIKYNGTFDIHHEDRLKNLKNYMNLLSEKVDINMNKYIIYNNQLSDKNNTSARNSSISSPKPEPLSDSKDSLKSPSNSTRNNNNFIKKGRKIGNENIKFQELLNDNYKLHNGLFRSYDYNNMQEMKLKIQLQNYKPQRCEIIKDHKNNPVLRYLEEETKEDKINYNNKNNIFPSYIASDKNNLNYHSFIDSNTNKSPIYYENNDLALRNGLLNKIQYNKLNNEEKWKYDKYNISNDVSKSLNKENIHERISNQKFTSPHSNSNSKIKHKRSSKEIINIIDNFKKGKAEGPPDNNYSSPQILISDKKKFEKGYNLYVHNVLINPEQEYKYNKNLNKLMIGDNTEKNRQYKFQSNGESIMSK